MVYCLRVEYELSTNGKHSLQRWKTDVPTYGNLSALYKEENNLDSFIQLAPDVLEHQGLIV